MNKLLAIEPLLSIIVVTWNARKYVDLCLRSLDRLEEIPIEVIMVDNASTDGTAELISKEFREFKLIRNSENLGFAKANNIGIRKSGGRFICLVNSDVTVPFGCLTKLMDYLDANPEVGIVGPQMIHPDGTVGRSTMRFPSLSSSLSRALGLDRFAFFSRLLKSQLASDFRHDKVADVDVLNGWFWIIRREALDQVGLLDERFFIYGEDIDWCRRFRQAGWRLAFFPEAQATHYGGASSSAAPVRFYIEQERADLQYWRKHHSPIVCCAYFGIVLLHNFLRLAAYMAVFSISRKRRSEAAAKVRRSWAMLAWMLGARELTTKRCDQIVQPPAIA